MRRGVIGLHCVVAQMRANVSWRINDKVSLSLTMKEYMMARTSFFQVFALASLFALPTLGLIADGPDEEHDELVLKTYRVAHLPFWAPPFHEKGHFDGDALQAFIQNSVSRRQWRSRGGAASLSFYEANLSLVVTASPKTHKAIEALLKPYEKYKSE
jgi:hypothetical protein